MPKNTSPCPGKLLHNMAAAAKAHSVILPSRKWLTTRALDTQSTALASRNISATQGVGAGTSVRSISNPSGQKYQYRTKSCALFLLGIYGSRPYIGNRSSDTAQMDNDGLFFQSLKRILQREDGFKSWFSIWQLNMRFLSGRVSSCFLHWTCCSEDNLLIRKMRQKRYHSRGQGLPRERVDYNPRPPQTHEDSAHLGPLNSLFKLWKNKHHCPSAPCEMSDFQCMATSYMPSKKQCTTLRFDIDILPAWV